MLAELGRTPEPKRQRMLNFMRAVAVLPEPEGLDRIAGQYVAHKLMPRDAQGDAHHLAFASLVGAEYLLTWNCRHLANQGKVRHLAVINHRLGLTVPILTTPDTLFPEDVP